MAKPEITAVSDSDTKAGAEKSAESEIKTKTADIPAEKNFVYIGPSLPSERLMINTVFSGTKGEILDYHKDVVERFPNVEKLFVPVERLAESRAKIRSGGNVLNKYYNDLLNQIRQKGAVE